MDRLHIILSVSFYTNTILAIQRYSMDYGFEEDEEILQLINDASITLREKRFDHFVFVLEQITTHITNTIDTLLSVCSNTDDIEFLELMRDKVQTVFVEIKLAESSIH